MIYQYINNKVNLDVLEAEIVKNIVAPVYISFDSPDVLKICFDPALTTDQHNILTSLVNNHSPKIGEKNYNIKIYFANNLINDIWYNTDNGDGTYSNKVEELIYSYENGKLMSHILKKYYMGDLEYYQEQFDYFFENVTKTIIVKRK